MFVGPRPTHLLGRLRADGDVLVCRDWPDHHEHLPAFYDFTGWATVARHRLVREPTLLCLQYDHVLTASPDEVRAEVARALDGHGFASAVAGYWPNWYLQVPGFEETLVAACGACGFDLRQVPAFDKWPSTQGTAWRTQFFYAFMDWVKPVFEVARGHVLAGHIAERMVHAYHLHLGVEPGWIGPVVAHRSLDCHGTGDMMRGDSAGYEAKKAAFAYQSS